MSRHGERDGETRLCEARCTGEFLGYVADNESEGGMAVLWKFFFFSCETRLDINCSDYFQIFARDKVKLRRLVQFMWELCCRSNSNR